MLKNNEKRNTIADPGHELQQQMDYSSLMNVPIDCQQGSDFEYPKFALRTLDKLYFENLGG